MRRYLLIVAATMAFFLMLFLAVEALGFSLLADPIPWMRKGGILAGTLGVSLLIADVILPVPSSLVMVAHGALFGVLKGTLLSLLGSVGSSLVGFAIGRRGSKLLDRLVTPPEKARADQMLGRWGTLAIVVTRPFPLLAETTAIMAGASPITWPRMALASIVGSMPPSLMYALTGASAANFESTALMFGAVLLTTGSFWVVGRLLDRCLSKRRNRRDAEQPDAGSDLKLAQE